MSALVWVGLGGNAGDALARFAAARVALGALGRGALVESPVYRSAPWGDPAQPFFHNQVVGLAPTQDPECLLDALQDLETAAGRCRAQERPWGPRPLDLDILSWPGVTRADARLTLPHPRLAHRRFVLAPWWHVAPGLVPSGLDRTVEALLADCPDSCWVRRCWR